VGIDPQSRHFLLEAIRAINAAGTTVVYSSHYMEEVESLCDEIGILDNGTLLLQGSLGELLDAARVQRLRIDASAPLSAVQQEAVVQACGARVVGARIELDACEPAAVPRILDVLARDQVTVAAVQYGAADLQEVFLGLAHRARDH
jgi:ABC-2 type transport system ATP-binding protein